jgi:hypothetical protein
MQVPRSTQSSQRKLVFLLAPCLLLIASGVFGVSADSAPKTNLHHAPNHNFDAEGQYMPGKFGFNLAEVNNVKQLDSLPDGVKGLMWIGQCKGLDATFLETVQPFVGKPNLFGFYLMDDPDPTGIYKPRCTPDNLKAESDWIHAHIEGTKTFIVLMNMGSSKAPSFAGTYNPTNSHIDLFGIDPYPCRTEIEGCDYEMIDRFVAAAETWGIPRSNMIPVYQTFGEGNWKDDRGGKYALPSARQMQHVLERWGKLLPAPVFDYAYSWGLQNADDALENSPDLRAVLARHNNASSP